MRVTGEGAKKMKPSPEKCPAGHAESVLGNTDPEDAAFVYGEPAEPVLKTVAALEGECALEKEPWREHAKDRAQTD